MAGIDEWVDREPTREELLESLQDTLILLSAALPLAMKHVGGENQHTQWEFWLIYNSFNEDQEIWSGGDFNPEEIDARLRELSEIVVKHRIALELPATETE